MHIKGAVVDFWATPAELHRRGYRLVMAKPLVWDVWGRVMPGGIEGCAGDRCLAIPRQMSV